MKNKFSHLTIILGVLIVLFSLLVDAIGLGKSGIQAAQILGIQAGVIIVLCGVALIILQNKREPSPLPFWLNLRDKIYNLPTLFWVALGILPAFIPLLIIPMFFNSGHGIYYPVEYLQNINPIGNDFRILLDSASNWLINHQTTKHIFTPLTIFLFSPLLLLGYPYAYYFIATATLISYLILVFLAITMTGKGKHPVIVFLATISLFSYGLQFELERGQSHTIALMLCVLAVYIFHKQPHFRLFAYLLFCISVQIKFYPGLFIVMFVDDWRDWKNILIRFGAIGVVNFLALFLLGSSYFSAFYNHTTNGLAETVELMVGNHSIQSFVFVLPEVGVNLLSRDAMTWVKGNADFISTTLYVFFLICFLAVLIKAYVKNTAGINFDLLLVCVIGALIVPSINHDYSLPLLVAPFAMFLPDLNTQKYPWAKIITILLIVIVSFTYSLTLFPIEFKPVYLQNSFPLLFVILIIVTVLSIAQREQSTQA